MRRSIILSTVLTAGIAVLGACDPKTEPVKPPATLAPTATTSPLTTPNASPTGSPGKGSPTPEGKKADVNGNNTKPAAAETPKTK